jgi:hypothetical protein
LNAPSAFPSLVNPVSTKRFSGSARVGLLSTYPPTPCGLATFSAALSKALCALGADVSVVKVADESRSSSDRVVGELINGSPSSVIACAELLNQNDVAVIQHEYGIYGGADGEEVVDVMARLQVPSIVIAHTIIKHPTKHQRSVLEAIAAMADQVVVMSDGARQRLCQGFDVDRGKVTTIPHGATIPNGARPKRPSRPTLLTWGLMGPGKGIERVICLVGRGTWLPAGHTRRSWPPMARHTVRPASSRRAASV